MQSASENDTGTENILYPSRTGSISFLGLQRGAFTLHARVECRRYSVGLGVGVLNGLGDAPVVRDLITSFASPSPNGIELFLIPVRPRLPR